MKFLADIEVEEGLKDSSGDLGTAGQILSSTGTGTNWIPASSGGGTISGSVANQQIAVGVSADTIAGYSYLTWTPQLGLVVGDHSQGGGANNITIDRPSTSPAKFLIKQNTTTEFSITTGGDTTIDTNTNDLIISDNSSASVGIGTTSPQSKLQVNGGVQIGNDADSASADKVGTFKYYTVTTVAFDYSYVDMCMQTGATTYEWVNIVTNRW